MNSARAAKDSARPTDCVAGYTAVLRVRSDFVAAYAGRASCYLDEGNAGAAVEDYSQAIRLSPSDPGLYVERGGAEEQIGNRTAAAADYNRVTEISSANPSQLLRAAEGLSAMGFYSDAVSVLDLGIRRYPNFWELHQFRADSEIRLGNDQEALREFQVALQLASGKQIAAVLSDRGNFYRLRQQYKLATIDYNGAIDADPSYYPNFEGRALVRLASSGDLAGAVADLTSAINIYEALHSPSRWPLASLYEERGKVYVQEHAKDKAILDFQRALSILTTAGPQDWRARLGAEIQMAGS